MHIAIDTSTDTASLALVQDTEILAELTWRCRQNHTVQLLPHLAHLLKQAGSTLKSAECIIVATGPGTFNGLRVGVSTAKGLAFSLSIPIVGVSTMEAEAYQHAETGLPVCAIFNAGREEVGTATYRSEAGEWRQIAVERLTTVNALCSEISTKTVFCGELAPAVADKLRHALGEQAVIAPPAARLRRAGFLAELGMKRFKGGNTDDVAALHPFYFRGPPITEAKRK